MSDDQFSAEEIKIMNNEDENFMYPVMYKLGMDKTLSKVNENMYLCKMDIKAYKVTNTMPLDIAASLKRIISKYRARYPEFDVRPVETLCTLLENELPDIAILSSWFGSFWSSFISSIQLMQEELRSEKCIYDVELHQSIIDAYLKSPIRKEFQYILKLYEECRHGSDMLGSFVEKSGDVMKTMPHVAIMLNEFMDILRNVRPAMDIASFNLYTLFTHTCAWMDKLFASHLSDKKMPYMYKFLAFYQLAGATGGELLFNTDVLQMESNLKQVGQILILDDNCQMCRWEDQYKIDRQYAQPRILNKEIQ